MKTTSKLVLFFITIIAMYSCTNDNSLEETSCNYKGASFIDPSNQEQKSIPESRLFIGYTNDIGNGATIEIYEKNNRDGFMFTTHVLHQNKSGQGFFHINGVNYTANVTCLKPGNNIGDEIQYTFTLNGKKGTFCGLIQDKI